MQVILKKDISQLGRIGEVVNVKGGYARNFLIPNSWAVAASKSNVKQIDHQKRLVEVHKKKIQKESQEVADSLKSLKVTLEKRLNEAGKLYANISVQEIVDELGKQKLKVDRRDIELETVKEAGEYPVKVRLPGDVYATVTLIIKGAKEKAAKTEKKAKAPATKAKKTTKAKSAEEPTEATEAATDTDSNE